jgi:hypothetical protein
MFLKYKIANIFISEVFYKFSINTKGAILKTGLNILYIKNKYL